MKRSKFLFLLLSFIIMSATALAQKRTISGVVVDNSNEPVIGASVVEKGTSNGSVTDFDGNFSVSVQPGATLVISYIGYQTQEVKAQDNLRITLQTDDKLLDEVVVVGYGVQKKSVVTASIAKVNSEDLASTAPLRMDNALKGLASGVQVTSSSGQPGAAARVRIRGVGSMNAGSDPLYIVDGMPIEGGLDYLNPSDIESLEVLKDAASGAIYGARAANGVVLVTTKKGKEGKVSVNYNFSQGWQSAWKHRDVLNATDYAVLINEGYINAGQAAPYANPYAFAESTDWQDLVFNDNAPVQNHELSVSGASEKVNYYLSLGYYTSEGIIGGNWDRSNYNRLTLRSNTKYNIFDKTKDRKWLNKLDVAVNLSYARIHSKSIDANAWQGSVLGSALALPPILKPYKDGQEALDEIDYNTANIANYVPFYTGRTDANGIRQIYMTPGTDYHEFGNPLAMLALPGDKGWSHKLVANVAADLQLYDGLTYHFSYGADQSFWGSDGYTPIYFIRVGTESDHTAAYSTKGDNTVWQIENTLSFAKEIDGHSFNVVLGQSAKKSYGSYLYGNRHDIIGLNRPYIDASTGTSVEGKQSVSGAPYDVSTLASLFGRISYNYDERYMAEVTVRRDGSSKFGPDNKYATFPSFSLGWNVMNEKFMEPTRNWLTNFKVRFSWGKNGNEAIPNFLYTVNAATGGNNNYLLGREELPATGSKASHLPNSKLKWEESEQTDFGLDFGFFNNKLTFTVDYYIKKTNGMLLQMPIPTYIGEAKPWGNVGEMKNSGVEFEASYKFRIADAKFRVSGNLSYLKNELVNYGNETGFQELDGFQGTGTITAAKNGEPFPYFYGYKTDGIFQNKAEVDEYLARQTDGKTHTVNANPVPGDVRFLDTDGDGVITENDRVRIGKGTPDWTYGINIAAEWRGFDFSAMLQGVWGNDIFDATRRVDVEKQNLPAWMLGRWTGEGTSNKYPRFVYGDKTQNWAASDLYLTDGAYMRLKNIQLGYTLPKNILRQIGIDRLRVFVAAENLLTISKYAGMDPEISSGATSLGVDYGVYPQARTWTVGFNLGF
ncbi:MAG: TonB-dependent receptor [Prevotella sp.]|nr:TonB-dependent receptor [Prevotella sp.]